MAKGPRRVKEFTFSARDGYSGSAGMTHVKPYLRTAKTERKAIGGAVELPSVPMSTGTGYVSPLRSQAARKAARTRRSSAGLKHLVD